jgi:hypothetical protein
MPRIDRPDPVAPESLVRDDFDATMLLLLWCGRKASGPLLWLGLTVGTAFFLFVQRDEQEFVERVVELQSSGDLVGALLSPFAIVAVAIGLRFLVALLAYAASYPLTRARLPEDYSGRTSVSRHWRLWRDRRHMTSAFRALRWTWPVHDAAVERLGRRGHLLAMCIPILQISGIVLFVVFVTVVFAGLSTAAS